MPNRAGILHGSPPAAWPDSRRPRRRFGPAAGAAAIFLALAVTGAPAQNGDVAGLLAAVARAPRLQAAGQRIEAARLRTEAAGRLADPEVEAMMLRANGTAMDEARDMWELNVRQPLPKRGERAADRDRARAVVALAEAEYAVTAGDLAAEVALSLAEAEGADRRARLLDVQINRLSAVLKSMDSRLAAGANVRLTDRLTVQTRVASMQLALEEAKRAVADAAAEVRGRLGLAPEVPLPNFAAPSSSEIIPAESAAATSAAARVAEAEAMRKMARASASPATAVGLRFERERTSMGNGDTIGIAFMSEIPYRSRRYARAEMRAAEAERVAADAEAEAARHQIVSALGRVERAERLAESARRFAREAQLRLHAEHEILSRAASVGASGGNMGGDLTVLHAVDTLDKITETQLQAIEAEIAAQSARAELWRHAPVRQLAAEHFSSSNPDIP